MLSTIYRAPDDHDRLVPRRACVGIGRKPLGRIRFFGSVIAKSAGDQQPDDVLSERLHWQIPDTEILYRGAIAFSG